MEQQNVRQLTDVASASATTSHECILTSHDICTMQAVHTNYKSSEKALRPLACAAMPALNPHWWALAKLCKTHKAGQAKAHWWQEILMKVLWKYIPYPAVKCSAACISLYFSLLHETNQETKICQVQKVIRGSTSLLLQHGPAWPNSPRSSSLCFWSRKMWPSLFRLVRS